MPVYQTPSTTYTITPFWISHPSLSFETFHHFMHYFTCNTWSLSNKLLAWRGIKPTTSDLISDTQTPMTSPAWQIDSGGSFNGQIDISVKRFNVILTFVEYVKLKKYFSSK